jgi:hypothetical protein
LGAPPTLPLRVEAAGCLAVGFEVARDVDAASPRAKVLFIPFDILDGGGTLREMGSPACSARVFRCLNAGSGTGRVSDLSGATGMERGSLQPEGLCLAVGIGIPLRAFAPASCNSPRALGGGDVMWEKVDGGLIPERFAMPYNGHEVRLERARDGNTYSVLVRSVHGQSIVPTSSEGNDSSKAYPGAAKSTSASSMSLTLVLRMSDIDCLGLRSDGKQRKARSLSSHAIFG